MASIQALKVNTIDARDRAKNWRLSLCKVCQGEIFFLILPDEDRHWWHEEAELDAEHLAEPVKGGKV